MLASVRRFGGTTGRAVLWTWVALLPLSHWLADERAGPDPAAGEGRVAVELASFDDDGPVGDARARLSLLRWGAPSSSSERTPVLCLHGSPGSARNFEPLGPALAVGGREVWALDLPGFGRSLDPDGGRSTLAHARACLAALDALGIERAHVVAWSMGGGVALHMAELAPERVASLALVASIGVQETEGTGRHAAEQLKYAALRAAIELLDRGLPHFGRRSRGFEEARSFARNFQESDQRPLRAMLERLATPLLVVHGEADVLASARAAQVSHELVEHSRLVLLDGNHFLPFTHGDDLARELVPFFARHDAAGTREPRSAELEVAPHAGAFAFDPWRFELGQRVPATLQALVWIAAGFLAPLGAGVVAGLALASLQFDPGWTLLWLAPGLIGAALRRRSARALLGPALALALAWAGCAGLAAGTGIGPGLASALALVLALPALAFGARYRARAGGAEEGRRAGLRGADSSASPP